MAIKFQCEQCGKEVEAPDDAGGKRGKCPYCRHSNYIPSPIADEDVLDLAPIDEEEERRRKEQAEAALEEERDLLVEMDRKPETPLEQKEEVAAEDLHHLVVNYCLDLAAGKLDQAEAHVQKLRPFGAAAVQAVREFASGKVREDALKDIPGPVVKGFLKQLAAQLR